MIEVLVTIKKDMTRPFIFQYLNVLASISGFHRSASLLDFIFCHTELQ